MATGTQIKWSASQIGLLGRLAYSTTVAASPSGASETTIATLTMPGGLTIESGVILAGWCAFTYGTSATTATVKVKRGSTVIGTTGALTAGVTQALLDEHEVWGVDTSLTDTATYTMTLTVASASAASTVSAVVLLGLAV